MSRSPMHKKLVVGLVAFLFIFISINPIIQELSANTKISQKNISSRGTFIWNGIITLDNDYYVDINDILTIEACTEINLDSGVRLIVDGRLIVEGTSSCPVIMNNQGWGDHEGILFESNSQNKGSKIDNLTIKNSDYGITVFGSNPQFNNIIIENPDKVGVDIYNGATPHFENLEIEGGGWDEHGGVSNDWRYGLGISVGNLSAPIFDGVYINGTLTRGINFWGNSGGLYLNIEISNVTGSTLAAAACIWVMDAIPYIENVQLNRCDNGFWIRQYDNSVQTNAVIRNSIIENSRFYGVIMDKYDRTNYTNYVMATFENLEISGTGGENANGHENGDGIAAIEVNVSGAIFEDVNLYDNPVPGLIAYLVDDTLFMRNITATNCGKSGIYGHDSGLYIFAAFDNGPPELVDINISNSAGSGIHVERGATKGEDWYLHNNTNHGLYIDHATVYSNWINSTNNGKSGAYIFDSSNVMLQNLTSISNGNSGMNNKDGSGIIFHLSNNVESNGRDVACINCTSIDDAFGGIYVEDSIDLYLTNVHILEPRNDGYGLYVDNNGLSQIGHINIDGMLLELNRSSAIVEINAAAIIDGLEIQGNVVNGLGLSWDGSSAGVSSSISNSVINSQQCISFSNLVLNGELLTCNGSMTMINSDINLSAFTAINSANVQINIEDANSILHLHQPINIDFHIASIETGSIIEEAYDLDVWVLNQFSNGLPFASIDVQFSNHNNDLSLVTDYLGYAMMPDHIVRKWTSSVTGATPSQNEEVDLLCTYDSTTNNTGLQVFSNDLTLYCYLTLSNQAPFIIWTKPEINEIFPSEGTVEFDANSSWDLDNDPLTYSWSSNIDGELLEQNSECISEQLNLNGSYFIANSASSLNCLSDGVHEITLEVCDDENACSNETRTVTLTNLPAIVNMETNPSADGDGVIRIPRSTNIEFDASGSYDPEGEELTILLTDSYHPQVGVSPDENMMWSLSFVDSPEDSVTVTITFDDGVVGNLVTWSIDIILFNEMPEVDFTIIRESNLSESMVTLDGSSSFDPENDEITVIWSSSLDGLLQNSTGIESLIWSGWLSSGTHEIELKIIDLPHQWEWVKKSELIIVENSPPTVNIDSPISGSTYLSSDLINFSAYQSGDWDSSCESFAGDTWYCNSLLPFVRSDLLSITWKSNLDGVLTPTENDGWVWNGRLSSGNHIITLEINDGFNPTISSSISISVERSAPVLILDSPNENSTLRSNESILFDLRRSIDYDNDEFTWSLKNSSGHLISNSGIIIENIDPKALQFISLPNGKHDLILILADSTGMESTHSLTLDVLSSNPVASITSSTAHFEGNTQTFTFDAGESILLSSEQSYDTDNDIISYEWEMMTDSNSWEKVDTENDNVNIFLDPNTYVFKLIVTDSLGLTGEKIVNVIVESSRPILSDLTAHPRNFEMGESSELRITIKLNDLDKTTKNVSAKIILNSQNWDLILNDNGTNGDATANDGIWTGVLTWIPNTEGFASIRVTAKDIDERVDDEVLDIEVGPGEFSIVKMFGGGANLAIGAFVVTLLGSLILSIVIRRRALRAVDLEDYIESWDSLAIEKTKTNNDLEIEDELDI